MLNFSHHLRNAEKLKWKKSFEFITTNEKIVRKIWKKIHTLEQGSQTRSPPDAFLRPAKRFSKNLWPAKLIPIKLRPVEHFFFAKWPFYQFEFETPAI